MLELVFIIPYLIGIVAFFSPVMIGRVLIVTTGIIEFALACMAAWSSRLPAATFYFTASPEGCLVLLVTTFLFLIIGLYTLFYLVETDMPREHIFNGCLLFFLGAMAMVAVSDHLVILWVAIEATTLTSAPLILLYHSKGSLEATWKYVLICSVGIALALLGTFFITLAMEIGSIKVPLTFSSLKEAAAGMDKLWLKAGFIFIMVGYGTKMGLAPMHTWLPDAHGESPSPVSALLSGALLNCAFLGIFKSYTILSAAGMHEWAGNLLVGFGLFSMLIASVFMIIQEDYKRLFAYSSIENMGIIAVGIGIGGLAGLGAMVHLVHHSLLKAALFLSTGNILFGYGTKEIRQVGGMARLLPMTFISFTCGFAGISGFPPFGLFVSELLIIFGAFQNHSFFTAASFIFMLILIFAGISKHFIRMTFAKGEAKLIRKERLGRVFPVFILLATSILLSLWLPEPLRQTILKTVSQI
ncbi:MAG TPA: hydrogenase [Desulfobulbaceae bacterium]|nr:hydrogenase [Desulfobulbaceae bacterium]